MQPNGNIQPEPTCSRYLVSEEQLQVEETITDEMFIDEIPGKTHLYIIIASFFILTNTYVMYIKFIFFRS